MIAKQVAKGTWVGLVLLIILGNVSAMMTFNRVKGNAGKELQAFLQTNKGPFLLLLYDSGCGHCRDFMPKFREHAEKIKQVSTDLNFATINMHEEYALIDEFISHGLATFPFIAYYQGPEFSGSFSVGAETDLALNWMDAMVTPMSKAETVKKLAQAIPIIRSIEIL